MTTKHASRARRRWFRILLVLALSILAGPIQAADAAPYPTNGWSLATPEEMGMDSTRLAEARSFALQYGGSGIVTRYGRQVYAWGDPKLRYDVKSTTKSIGGSAMGLAIFDGRLSFADRALQRLPAFGVPPDSNTATGCLDDITLLQLATHTSGFEKAGGYGALLYTPGTTWLYSDGGVNWLADIMTATFREDLNSLLFRRVFTPLGITTTDLVWRNNTCRGDLIDGVKRREVASGISVSVDAMARIGYLYLRGGRWESTQLLPAGFTDTVGQPDPSIIGTPVNDPVNFPQASSHYGVLWHTNVDGTLPDVPQDAYWAWGLGDSLIIVIPSLDIVVARAGAGFGRTDWNSDYKWIAPFITPIARSVIKVLVPDVVGLTRSVAESQILMAGLKIGAVTQAHDPTIPSGSVISQLPAAGTLASNGASVALVVSTGPATTGSYLDFDGVNDRVSVPSSASLRLSSAITLEAWIRPHTLASDKNQDRVVRKGANYEISVSTGDTGCSIGTIGDVQWRAKIAGLDRRICGGRLIPGRWHHVAGTYNGKTFRLYLDGMLVASMSRSGKMATSTELLAIGNHATSVRPFDGDIDRVAVWRRALSASEVLNRAGTRLLGTESGLVSYWSFDDGTGQAVRDATTNANHGVLGTSSGVESSDPAWRDESD